MHRDMKHPRVVRLFDVFEIDGTAFATVLEYCKGIDLHEKFVCFILLILLLFFIICIYEWMFYVCYLHNRDVLLMMYFTIAPLNRLKRLKIIPEKDAKAIFMQIMSGLR